MKVAAIVGSIRQESFNGKLVEYMQDRYSDIMDIDILDIRDLPHYDQDEESNAPDYVQEYKRSVREADAVLIATPEYNGSISGVLKNALDWNSRVDYDFAGKPTMLVGASLGGLGTVKAQMHLRQILSAPGMSAKVLPGNEVLIGAVHEKMDENGNLTDQGTIDFLDNVVAEFERFYQEATAVANRA
ncbi:NADPH-dependent FMN reductase [Marinococcus sp. PL1-022]|uniref:NADPH-dependent FMN reductase n=1 Tax=Marinococcus sp. PL1-022 TaxID=3095363 RepID=UPI00262C6217|nr:NADPH-dependent FMN reductase [Marinococcus sp. PL1-022]MDX6152203.1 NADPH-dependent FMN reductase [Marinococcus sp. PL1-022]